MKKLNSEGFGVAEVCLAVLILGIVGFGGYKVYSNRNDKKANQQTTTPANTAATTSNTTTDKAKPAEERTPLGDYSFVFPSQWNNLKKVTPGEGDKALVQYTFKVGSDVQKNGTTFPNAKISLYKATDVDQTPSAGLAVYDVASKTWKDTDPQPISKFEGIVADYFGDGIEGTYHIGAGYYLVKDDKVIGVGITETGRYDDADGQYSFDGHRTFKSNALQEQIVSLLNSVK